ncbi:MAG: hypothetical protein H0V56_12065 [Chthoniobacterales bacterium]|nr:hypothetical protein [Chthoniobacterales bacterium]
MEKSPPRLGDPLSHALRPANGAGERHHEEEVPFTLVGFYKELVSLIPKETRKAVRKTVRRAILKHGPEIATAIVTGVLTSVITAASTAKTKKKKKRKKK